MEIALHSEFAMDAFNEKKDAVVYGKSTALDAVRKEQKNVLRVRNYPPSDLRTVSFFFFLSLFTLPPKPY